MAMRQLKGDPEPGYSISLLISRTTAPHTVAEGQWAERSFPGETRELAKVKLRGTDLEALLSDTKEHIDLVRTPSA